MAEDQEFTLPPLEKRPIVTFALFAYNQEKYIREAVEGAFAQTYEPLEIILSDDCSTDRTFEVMEEMAKSYSGPHKIIVRQNLKNLGIAEHFNTLLQSAKGEIIIAAAGDDISLPERSAAAAREFLTNQELTFVEFAIYNFSTPSDKILYRATSDPRLFELKDYFKKPGLGLVGAGRSYRRDVLLQFPPLIAECPTEDSTSLLRCLLFGPGKYIPYPLILRRLHEKNISRPNAIPAKSLEAIKTQYQIDLKWAFDKKIIEKVKIGNAMKKITNQINSRIFLQKRTENEPFLSIVSYGIHQGGIGMSNIKSILRALLA